jgi:glycosyltransferase involved in cell wall biosynthesis
VLSVGNDRARDIGTMYAACDYVSSRRPGTRFLIQTSDQRPQPPSVTRVARLRDHAELRALYATCQLVAIATFPNLYTSGSTVALEAQASARAVVMSGTPGTEAYVRHQETGLLVSPGDHEALGKAMLELLNDPDRANAMGARGADIVRRANSTESMTDEIAHALWDALDA